MIREKLSKTLFPFLLYTKQPVCQFTVSSETTCLGAKFQETASLIWEEVEDLSAYFFSSFDVELRSIMCAGQDR